MLSWGTNRSQSFSVILSHSQSFSVIHRWKKFVQLGLNFGGVNFCECCQLLHVSSEVFLFQLFVVVTYI